MFAFPQVFSLPALGLGVGTIEWPWLGAFSAWFVLAALVGATLGFLREQTSGTFASTNRPPKDVFPKTTGRIVSHRHREAA